MCRTFHPFGYLSGHPNGDGVLVQEKLRVRHCS